MVDKKETIESKEIEKHLPSISYEKSNSRGIDNGKTLKIKVSGKNLTIAYDTFKKVLVLGDIHEK